MSRPRFKANHLHSLNLLVSNQYSLLNLKNPHQRIAEGACSSPAKSLSFGEDCTAIFTVGPPLNSRTAALCTSWYSCLVRQCRPITVAFLSLSAGVFRWTEDACSFWSSFMQILRLSLATENSYTNNIVNWDSTFFQRSQKSCLYNWKMEWNFTCHYR